jgi:transposase
MGWKQHQIAVALGVSGSAVSDWLAKAQHDGTTALRSHSAQGRPPKHSAEQLRLVPDFLRHGPEAYGFHAHVRTCERVVGVMHEEFGVSDSKSPLSRPLKRLGWTQAKWS